MLANFYCIIGQDIQALDKSICRLIEDTRENIEYMCFSLDGFFISAKKNIIHTLVDNHERLVLLLGHAFQKNGQFANSVESLLQTLKIELSL